MREWLGATGERHGLGRHPGSDDNRCGTRKVPRRGELDGEDSRNRPTLPIPARAYFVEVPTMQLSWLPLRCFLLFSLRRVVGLDGWPLMFFAYMRGESLANRGLRILREFLAAHRAALHVIFGGFEVCAYSGRHTA